MPFPSPAVIFYVYIKSQQHQREARSVGKRRSAPTVMNSRRGGEHRPLPPAAKGQHFVSYPHVWEFAELSSYEV